MLRNVLGDYLDNVKEREFDLPLISLLPAMGFYDVHYTHGQAEFGKDFIAKRIEDGVEIQYSFQSKAGDIGQADWRNDIMGQMLEAILTGLSHPRFDRQLPHQSVLVTTGRLIGNAPLGLQDLNERIIKVHDQRPIILWDKQNLLEYLETYGLTGIHQATASGFTDYASFFLLYGKSLQGNLSEREIEQYSYQWISGSLEVSKRLLRAAIEVEIIATKCISRGYVYEAIHAYLGAVRAILLAIHSAESPESLIEIYQQALAKLHATCDTYVAECQRRWIEAGRDLLKVENASLGMMSYLAKCARIIEITGFLHFLESNDSTRETIDSFLSDFISTEPGCGCIPSDRYAISLVLPTLALCDRKQTNGARDLLHRTAIWLCDRFEQGIGLAALEADEYTETLTLLGYPFDFIKVPPPGGSLLAAVLCDLAAFVGDSQFYSDVVNDIKATKVFPIYWQAVDTVGQFSIEGEDVIAYPNIQYADTLTDFRLYQFAEHIVHEPQTFRLVGMLGPVCLMTLMLLLRDRYFPTQWPLLVQHCDEET